MVEDHRLWKHVLAAHLLKDVHVILALLASPEPKIKHAAHEGDYLEDMQHRTKC